MIITTERLLMRPLTVEDATERYLSWFSGPGAGRITASKTTQALADLEEYIRAHASREDVLFLGIFEQETGYHIGNLKYEPVLPDGRAVLGIFLGDETARGKGYAGEAIAAANRWLKDFKNVRTVVLGVEADNEQAIRAYKKLGFCVSESELIPTAENIYCMSIEL